MKDNFIKIVFLLGLFVVFSFDSNLFQEDVKTSHLKKLLLAKKSYIDSLDEYEGSFYQGIFNNNNLDVYKNLMDSCNIKFKKEDTLFILDRSSMYSAYYQCIIWNKESTLIAFYKTKLINTRFIGQYICISNRNNDYLRIIKYRNDIEKWDDFIVRMSILDTPYADGYFNIVSKVYFQGNNLHVENKAFGDY